MILQNYFQHWLQRLTRAVLIMVLLSVVELIEQVLVTLIRLDWRHYLSIWVLLWPREALQFYYNLYLCNSSYHSDGIIAYTRVNYYAFCYASQALAVCSTVGQCDNDGNLFLGFWVASAKVLTSTKCSAGNCT